MSVFQARLFLRIILKSREVYFLKVITLAIAFACSTLVLLFSISEFGFDKFHHNYRSIFRILQRNNSESLVGNRLSNKIPVNITELIKTISRDSLITSKVKLLDKVSIISGDQHFNDAKLYAADPEITDIFSFDILDGSLNEFQETVGSVMLSSQEAIKYFGTAQSAGKKLMVYTFGDTVSVSVAAVYKDYPQNSHEDFKAFIRFEPTMIRALNFNPEQVGIFGRMLQGDNAWYTRLLNREDKSDDMSYQVQSVSEIYFGPRVDGEDASHGDQYSIVILICITALILFLAFSSFVNLTTLSLPHRSKELAVKKLAGTSQTNLTINFMNESLILVGSALLLGIVMLLLTSSWLKSVLDIDMPSLLLQSDLFLILILMTMFFVISIAPLLITSRFVRATPNRLLSTDTITFPRFKRIIMFLQLGISIFLIVSSMVIRRQINYSLIKEPGRNYDQIVYVRYPKGMTDEGIFDLRTTWKKINPNVLDVMATSQLPDRVSSKELNSEFYSMSVDRGFKDFFELEMIEGNWFKANDGDSIVVVNEQGSSIAGAHVSNMVGVFKDIAGRFNQPAKPLKINVAQYFNYNFLCIRVLEVDIRRTVSFLESYFEREGQKATVSFFDKRFEAWLRYQDRLNMLSEVLAIISGLLSCCAIYGLSISVIRDKIKQIAIRKLCGATTMSITRLLVREFAKQMLIAILFFGPATYIIMNELLRNFVYATHFNWLDPIVPLGYCAAIITLLCGFHAMSLGREDLSAALKS